MTDKPDAIQELLVKARRAQILDAATRVFAEKGFHRATIKDIARTAGIADGTIYTYFPSKTEVLLAILNRLNETTEREQQFAEGSAQDARTFFQNYLRQRITLLWSNIEVFQAILPELLSNSELREQYFRQTIEPTFLLGEQYLRQQSEQGLARKSDASLITRAIAGNVLGLLILQLLGDEELARRWEELPEVLTTLIFDGLQIGTEPSSE